MNNFANSLLHILLSWMRTLFSGLLSFAQDGSSGFIAWLSGHWISLTVILLTLGIVLDTIIYLLRWRPQYVWRTKLNRALRKNNEMPDDPEFLDGYNTALPNFNFEDTPIPDLSKAADPSEIMESYFMEPAPAQQQPAEDSQQDADDLSSVERRRRSQRHEKRALGRFRLPDLPDLTHRKNDLPIDARYAFHEPVYPETESYQQEQHGDNY
ncbi:MAG: hypothetical protein IJ214_00230 [Clostridia bacterium]|nr:hypothetical protein [Clostridia bacterium]